MVLEPAGIQCRVELRHQEDALPQELQARLTRKPVLIGWATVNIMANEMEKSRFSHAKSKTQLGLEFRSIEETLRDEVGWYRSNGYLPA